MKEALLNELDKYFNLPDDLSEIEYIEMTVGDNIEDIFLWYYRRQLKELHWYKYEGEESNKTKSTGVILYESENKVKGWREAISKAEYYILYSDRITVHYRDNQGCVDMKIIDYKPLIDAIKNDVGISLLDEEEYKTPRYNDKIRDLSNNILSELSDCTIGKFNKAQSKVNELFVKKLYPYFLYLRNKEEAKTAEEQSTNKNLHLTIMKNLGLPSNYEKQIKNAFSNKTDPPPLKIDIQYIKPYE